MTDRTKAPERIWAYAWNGQTRQGQWHSHEGFNATEYIRAALTPKEPT